MIEMHVLNAYTVSLHYITEITTDGNVIEYRPLKFYYYTLGLLETLTM